MAIRASLVLLLLAVVVAPTLCEGREYKPCPTKGYYPKKANTTYTRCLAANELSCCQDCEDQYIMLRSISVNGTTLLDQFSPGLGEALGGKDLSLCGTFNGFPDCERHLEQVLCAINCNPDQGDYEAFDKKAGTVTFYICDDYATELYGYCKDLQLPGFGTISSFFPTKEQLFGILFGALGSSTTFSDKYNYTTVIQKGTDGCYNGPVVMPDNLLCCDHFDVPGECIPRVINTTAFPEMIPFINQTQLSPTCKIEPGPSEPPSEAPPPSTPSVTSSSPPSTPTPSSPVTGSTPPPGPKSGTQAAPGLVAFVLCFALFLIA